MVAYAGTFTLEAEKVTHHIDISWNQAWTGTDQVRFYTLDGDMLSITTAPYKSYFDGKEGRSILVWKKVRYREIDVPSRASANQVSFDAQIS